MTSVERYRLEWSELLRNLDTNPERIRDLAIAGDLKMSKFRSVFWSLLLRVLNHHHHNWSDQRELQRKKYEKLKQEFVKNPHDVGASDDDPLSQSTQSTWNQYFSDQELYTIIRQDVVRTFPGVDFFRKSNIQNAMSNILFYYAREHPYMCYRQGMHEILAPILFVVFSDHQSLLHFKEIVKGEIDETLLAALNPNYLEADSYSIFSRLMSSIESYYRISNLNQSSNGYFLSKTDSASISTEVEVISQLNSIRDNILAKEDLHLHNYLIKMDIPLHIFGIRWLRLLFGREFALLDLLILWDAIFADSDHFHLPNFILVSMLIRIRNKLLLSDYTTCMTYLMRYPANEDVNLILRHALHMQMPKKFERPPNVFTYFTLKKNDIKSKSINNFHKKPQNYIMEKSALDQQQPKKLNVETEISMKQIQNAADSAAMARFKLLPESDKIIMEGYAKNSPELMRLELKNAQTVITIAKDKLQMYLVTVRKHCKNNSEELTRALDGIEELCSFLDVKFMFPLQRHSTPIDLALEANEQQRQSRKFSPISTKEEKPKASQHFLPPFCDIEEDTEKSHEVWDKTLSNKTLPKFSGGIMDLGMDTNINTIYEKPDDSFMLNSSVLLGSLKDIELISIVSDEKIVKPINTIPSPKN